MFKNNRLNFIGCDNKFEESDIVLFGAPFDGTTSFRPGARFASNAIRVESEGIETYSPYQEKDIENKKIYDNGDLEFPFGNVHKTMDIIYRRTKQILDYGKIPVMIGGEHLVSYGTVKAIKEKYEDIYILHFDAHADLRENYLGEDYSHATVMRRIFDIVGKNKIYQLGIRSGTKDEFDFAKKNTNMCKFDLDKIDEYVDKLKGKNVYVTIDLDVLDPSIFSGTGTPEAGGVNFKTLLDAVLKLKNINIVGADINELSPMYDNSGVSTAVACKILRELLLVV